jgi:hypothetical protein
MRESVDRLDSSGQRADRDRISESRRPNDVEHLNDTPRSQPSRLPTIPNSPNTTPRKPAPATKAGNVLGRDDKQQDTTPKRIPLKTVDGPSPMSTASLRRRETDTDTLVSDRQSVMSFAFKGSDQIRPVQKRVRAPTGSLPPGRLTGTQSTRPTAALPNPRMNQANASAKFAHRLRSPETVPHEDELEEYAQTTIRLQSSKARRSLPPAMALQPSTNLPEQGLRNGTLLNPPRIVSNASTYSRGIKGSTPPLVAGRNISAATAKRMSMKAEQTAAAAGDSAPTASSSGESTLAMWKAYGAANTPEETPRRVFAGRQLGGRI